MKVIINYTFFLYLLFQINAVFGKSNQHIREIINSIPDTNKVKSLSDLCWDYRFVSADSALFLGEQALELARKINYSKGIAQACNDIGIIYIDKGQYLRATKLLNESLGIREKLKDLSGIASIYNKLGIIDQKQGRLKEALEHQISALKIYEKLGQDKWIGYCLNNIAIIHQNLGDLDKALEYHQKALEYRKILKDQLGEATSYANMANLYSKMHDTISAIGYYEKSLSLSRSLKNDELISGNLSNIANIYLAQKDFNKAMNLYSESLRIRERLGDSKGISSTLSRIGSLYIEIRQFKEAGKVLNRSLSIAKNISVTEEELSAVLGLARLKALTNQRDSSFILMNRYIAAKDSVYDARIKQQILDVQSQYETDKLEQDLELVRKEKEYTEVKLVQRKTEIWLLIFVFISISGAGIFLFYRHQQRQKTAADAERIKEQEARINAVFQAQEQERRRIAKELHDGIGQTISAVKLNYQSLSQKIGQPELIPDFRKVEKMLESAGTEVRNISHQMIPKELEQFGLVSAVEGMLNLNFENSSLKVQFEHSGFTERLGQQIELVLFRVLQELVSNVIKHAQARQLSVQLIRFSSYTVLNVSDDGIGFDSENKGKSGIGLLNMTSRIDAVKGHLHFESEPGKRNNSNNQNTFAMSKIKVLLTDDHQIIVDGLKSLLENSEEITVCAEANNGREALRILELLSIDVVLMDIDMPVMNGIDALKEIRKQFRDVKVIILSMHKEAGMIKSLMDIGANGYLLKSCAQDELISAIKKVFAGQNYFSTDVTLALLNPSGISNSEQRSESLTDRETEILKLISAGFSNREIGDQLFISHRTVDTHRTNLMKKLNVNNIAGLISYAIKNGIV